MAANGFVPIKCQCLSFLAPFVDFYVVSSVVAGHFSGILILEIIDLVLQICFKPLFVNQLKYFPDCLYVFYQRLESSIDFS